MPYKLQINTLVDLQGMYFFRKSFNGYITPQSVLEQGIERVTCCRHGPENCCRVGSYFTYRFIPSEKNVAFLLFRVSYDCFFCRGKKPIKLGSLGNTSISGVYGGCLSKVPKGAL